jgi:hypothetical protein
MATTVRVATFNLENFYDQGPTGQPTLVQRIALMRPQLERLRADVLCLQEVNSRQVHGVRTEFTWAPRVAANRRWGWGYFVSRRFGILA